MPAIPIVTTRVGGFDVLRPVGTLDIASAAWLRTVLDGLFSAPGRRVVVDLSEVDLIDCSAIGSLVYGRGLAERSQGVLLAVQATPLVVKIAQITGVAKALGVELTLADVVDAGPPESATEERGQRAIEVLLRLIHRLPADAPERPALRADVIELAMPFASALAGRFRGRGQSWEDLDQVAMVGLLKAVDRYDPAIGTDFAAFAAPTILGEVRRHFRDKGWYMQVPRRMQELRLRIRAAQPALAQQLARSPTVDDLAHHLRVEAADVLAALEATRAYEPRSLSAPVRGGQGLGLEDLLGGPDGSLSTVEDREVLGPALAQLRERERQILAMRFYGNLTQAEIGTRLGISQMHVSRLLAGALRTLRRHLEDVDAG